MQRGKESDELQVLTTEFHLILHLTVMTPGASSLIDFIFGIVSRNDSLMSIPVYAVDGNGLPATWRESL